MGRVVLFPPIVAQRRWLLREGLRIAAGTNGASLDAVRRSVEGAARSAGVDPAQTAEAVDEAVCLVERVRDGALQLVGRAPPPSRNRPGAA